MVNSYENGTGQSLDVVFSRPPSVYNFRRFQVALVPVEDYIQIQIDVTTDVSDLFFFCSLYSCRKDKQQTFKILNCLGLHKSPANIDAYSERQTNI